MFVTTNTDMESAYTSHSNCIVCGSENPRGLHLKFLPMDDASVESSFFCSHFLEGYAGRLHGGVIASVLDSAMTHCLFLNGYAGVTVELNVRYKLPVITQQMATVRGWLERTSSLLYLLKAEILQNSQVKATAMGKFMNLP